MSKPPRPPKSKSARPPKSQALGVPDDKTLINLLSDAEAGAKDLAKTLGLKGADRRVLRERLRAIEQSGGISRRGRKSFQKTGAYPPVGVADIVGRDSDGEYLVRLVKEGDDLEPAVLTVKAGQKGPNPGLGERILAKFSKTDNGWQAETLKILSGKGLSILGVVRKHRGEVRLEPVDRKVKESFIIVAGELKLLDGDLVRAKAAGGHEPRFSSKRVIAEEVLGREDDPRMGSLIAIATHGVPMGFSAAAEAEAEAAKAPTLAGRTDLRSMPLITIDPEDARDHDDAVYAYPDEDPKNPGGQIVWVAIADVAAYVREGSALDKDAYDKGNSTYFPDRVEPMLPHALSSGLCSLKEGEPRACLAVKMTFNASGKKLRHEFVRGLMRSAAKLSYEQAQGGFDGAPDDKTGPLVEPILRPLLAAYQTLLQGRERRSPLAIESTERKIELDADGHVVGVRPRASLTAHKLIEEMMIQANVCAAETLAGARLPVIYRVHEAPSLEKLNALADFLGTLDMPWSRGEPARTERFNALLNKTRDGPHADIVNEVVLRTQMQAHYNPENAGHFGLNLTAYAHFTSPIRRYADLTVHRGLIRALNLGGDGASDGGLTRLPEIADHITMCERRSMAAERDATDRFIAAFLADKVGATFEGRVTGVTRFGLFIRLLDTGADGLAPVSTLGDEYFIHDDAGHCLIGERSGRMWRLGALVQVRLLEATPVTGGLVLEVLSEPAPADPNRRRPRLGVRSRASANPPGRPKLPPSRSRRR